jgi:hypothetical protein
MQFRKSQVPSRLAQLGVQAVWFTTGAVCGFVMLSISKASISTNVPSSSSADRLSTSSSITNDTAIYQNLSEIQANKEHSPNFDSDISSLSKMEGRYRERPQLTSQRRVARRAATPQQSN